MIVADNTLISYFTIEGEFTEEAVRVRKKDPAWAAPLLWQSESANVLWMYVRQEEFGLDLALEHLETAEDLIGERTYQVASVKVLRMAVASECSAYDCRYVALAQNLDVKEITHDRKVLNAFPETATHPADFLDS